MGCQPGSSESAPCVTWSVFGSSPLQHGPPLPGGRRPLTHSSRREVVSGPAHTRGAHPTASGRLAMAVRTQSLWVASPGVMSQPPFSTDRSLGRRPSSHERWRCLRSRTQVALSQRGWNNNSAQPSRGCLHRVQKVVNVPHHCLETVSVAMHTSSAFAFREASPQARAARVLRLRCRCRRHSTQNP